VNVALYFQRRYFVEPAGLGQAIPQPLAKVWWKSESALRMEWPQNSFAVPATAAAGTANSFEPFWGGPLRRITCSQEALYKRVPSPSVMAVMHQRDHGHMAW